MSKPKVSKFDKFLASIAPGLAADRMAKRAEFDFYAGGYDAVQTSRFRTHQAWNRSRQGTEDNLIGSHDRQSVRLECLDLWRNNEIVRGLVERFVDYSVADGITPQAQTTDPVWNQLAETWWRDIYVPTADFRNQPAVTLTNHQQFVVSDRLLSGDIGFIMLKNGQLQPIESPRICTPQEKMNDPLVVEGVKTSKSGVVTGYYVCPRKDGGGVDNTKAKFIPAENFIHCYRPGRADQLRGVAELAPAVNKLRDYDTTDQFVLNKIKNDASILTVKTKTNKLSNERSRNAYQQTDANGDDPTKVEKREWGNEITLNPGEDYNSFDGKAPNQQYVPYLEHELKAIAACVNLPYEFVMLIFTSGSFSAQRAAMLHAQKTFTDWHQYVINVFLRRVWNWRIAKAMKEGALPQAPLDAQGRSQWHNVEWSNPHFGWIDPLKQVQAQRDRIRVGVSSLELETRSEGKEVNDLFEDTKQTMILAQQKADEANAANPEIRATWKDFTDTGRPDATLLDKADDEE
jgi:lambda family phage portal protein